MNYFCSFALARFASKLKQAASHRQLDIVQIGRGYLRRSWPDSASGARSFAFSYTHLWVQKQAEK